MAEERIDNQYFEKKAKEVLQFTEDELKKYGTEYRATIRRMVCDYSKELSEELITRLKLKNYDNWTKDQQLNFSQAFVEAFLEKREEIVEKIVAHVGVDESQDPAYVGINWDITACFTSVKFLYSHNPLEPTSLCTADNSKLHPYNLADLLINRAQEICQQDKPENKTVEKENVNVNFLAKSLQTSVFVTPPFANNKEDQNREKLEPGSPFAPPGM